MEGWPQGEEGQLFLLVAVVCAGRADAGESLSHPSWAQLSSSTSSPGILLIRPF